MYRLERVAEEGIDRTREIRFCFEGRNCQGYAGDTISSALLASGLGILGRSFKYHRPRSVLSFANHDSNLLFQVNGVPNVRGDVTALSEGMNVTAINTVGGLQGDKARVLGRLSRFLPVGFYYKAFHSRRLFPRWEQLFRRMTGLGVVSISAPRVYTPKRYAFCDVLVVGAGPSGLCAALEAAQAGAKVVLVEEHDRLGGSIMTANKPEFAALKLVIDAVLVTSSIAVLPSTVAAGHYADHWVALVDAHRMTKIRAKSVVFATGVIEQPAVFRNNDLPGVMLASAARRLASCYRVAPGRNVVIVTANQEGYEACLELLDQGITVSAIVDWRDGDLDEGLARTCAKRGTRVLRASVPYEACRGSDGTVNGLKIAAIDLYGTVHHRSQTRLECDAVLMSVGWAPAAQLLAQAGGTAQFASDLQQFVPKFLPAGVFTAGRLNGVYHFEARCIDGRRAGSQAAASVGFGIASTVQVPRTTRQASHPFPIVDHDAGKNFIDFDEDLQVKDLQNAVQEGFDSSELLKRYTTVGMGPSQGKHSNMNALRVLARARGISMEDLGLTTARPLYHPVPLKILAGRSFSVERRTPIDEEHARLGAVWMPAGNWRRPEYYAISGETRAQSIEAEVRAVRNGVGLIDVGTLGKIEIHGPQAGEFLDRTYAGMYSTLRVGMSRYGLMLDESGVIVDDGVIARLAADSFYFTTTTGGSSTVYRELLRLNALWGLDCVLANITGHCAAFNFAGPASRERLRGLVNTDLSDAAFPFLAVRSGRIAGADVRLLRVGFVGELAYEIHVPASAAVIVWKALLSAGGATGVRPFGVEAQRRLRLEKGHLIVGQDTDGLTDPFEANAAWAVNMNKPFFVGQRSLRILRQRGPRQVLIGFQLLDSTREAKESHLLIDEGGEIAGRVTSVMRSSTLNKVIGLALLMPQHAQGVGNLHVRIEGGELIPIRINPTPFYDPKNERQKAAVGA